MTTMIDFNDPYTVVAAFGVLFAVAILVVAFSDVARDDDDEGPYR